MDDNDSMMDTDCGFRDAKQRRKGDESNHGNTNSSGGVNGFYGQGVLGGGALTVSLLIRELGSYSIVSRP
jgi:hypothetical protein